ncbi:MAG: ATP-binding protein [Hydrogenophaga sp.]
MSLPINTSNESLEGTLEALRVHRVELEMQNLQLRDAQEQLEAARQKYFKLFDLAPVAFLTLDAQRRVVEANVACANLLGTDRQRLLNYPLASFLSEESRPLFQRHLDAVTEHGRSQDAEVRLQHLRGDQVVYLQLSSSRLDGVAPCVLVAAIDVSEQRLAQAQQERLEQQVRSTQKMDALGRMAGGIAHDFNNLLHAIAGFTDLASSDTDPADVKESLGQIRKATQRASRLTQQILAFSRRHPIQPEAVYLDRLLLEMAPMLQRLLRTGVSLDVQTPSDLLPVWIDKGQLEQVVTNLVLNAADAMSDGGQIVLRTQIGRNAKNGAEAMVMEVEDSGTGLSKDVLEQMFDPFYTTKPKGQGTGLGLSVVHGIVARHGGEIVAENRPEGGAVFRIRLPTAVVAKKPYDFASDFLSIGGSGEWVLLAEDEQVLRGMAARMLQGNGYQVVTAFDGQDAIEKYRDHAGPAFSLLLLDVIMPRLGGVEVYNQLSALGNCPPVLFVSGYVGDVDRLEAVRHETQFLAKPFGEPQLLQAINRCLIAR